MDFGWGTAAGRQRHSLRRDAADTIEGIAKKPPGRGVECGYGFRRAARDELAAVRAGLRTEIENPIGGFDDIEIVLYDQQRVA